MCIGGAPSVAAPPPPPPPPPAPSTIANPAIQGQSAAQAQQARAAGGVASTMLTGPMGLSQQGTAAPKTLLGQ